MQKINILLAGEAGQGIQAIENLLARVLKSEGYHLFATKEYMSRIRGGVNSTTVTIAERPIDAWHEKVDVFIPLVKEAAGRYRSRLKSDTLIMAEGAVFPSPGLALPLEKASAELGSPIFANTVASGALFGLLAVEKETAAAYLRRTFAGKGQELVEKNLRAFEIGYRLTEGRGEKLAPCKSQACAERLLMNGADAISLGAITGGCNACFAYPMTPSTSVFTNLAGWSRDHDLVVEQVEDEIGVVNMALGCWYAGGRALVTTSGGGFALMTEGLSLAGMTETPLVVHLAGRPGPATGMPTRTEQGDLNLALYAGHGTFPRIILAPGNLHQAFELTARAFDLADRFQTPVIILTDQYFIDSYYDIEPFGPISQPQAHFIRTEKDYRRYAITADGISPRGIPGWGEGLVAVDSDEHDEEGRITEDLNGVALKMKEKRLKKFATVEGAALSPLLYGRQEFDTLLIAWGSIHNTLLAALEELEPQGVSFMFLPQLFPLHPQVTQYLSRARRIIAVENNQTGQLADLLQQKTGVLIKERILKYDGLPFSVEALSAELKERL